MKKHILTATLLLPAVIALTSCIDTDKENHYQSNLTYGGSQCFNIVTDKTTGEYFISTDPQYSFLLDYTNNKITPSMSNIKLTENGSGLSFKLPELSASPATSEYTYACSGSDLVPTGQTQAYVFDRYTFKCIERVLQNSSGQYFQSPVYDVNFTVNNRYIVQSVPTSFELLGTTTATGKSADDYATKQSIYKITLNTSAKTASITITDAKFASDLTYSDMGVKDVPYTVNQSGITIMTESGMKYQLYDRAGTVKDAYFSDINLHISIPSGTTYLTFHSDITGLEGSSSVKEYDVNANLSYYMPLDK